MSKKLKRPSGRAGRLLKKWMQLGAPLRFNRRARSLDWEPAQCLSTAAEPVLRANSHRLKLLLEESNRILSPLADPLLTDYGVHRWLSGSREEAYSDWLAWILKQVKDPRLVLRVLDIDDPVAETSLRGITLDPDREMYAAEGHPGHTGRTDLRIVVRGKLLIEVEVKLNSADVSDVAKNAGYTASAKSYGAPKRHWHRRLLATDGDETFYPGATVS
jgi:hypothetical protein